MNKLQAILLTLLVGCSQTTGPSALPVSATPTPTPAPCTSAAIRPASNHPVYMRPRGYPVSQSASALPYNGGKVLVQPLVYVVFWSLGAKNAEAKRLVNFLASVGGSQWADTMTQYCESPNIYITNPTGNLAGVWHDQSTPPHSPSQAALEQEALRAAAFFNVDTSRASVVVALNKNTVPSGFGIAYCAYHASVGFNGGQLSWTNLPYIPAAGKGCGAQSVTASSLDGVSIVEGHELAESITDPVPPTGWSGAEEIGDLCAWMHLQETLMPDGQSFPTQPLWSNLTMGCVQ